jgi:hypothetical protein
MSTEVKTDPTTDTKGGETPTVESLTAALKAKDDELASLKTKHDGAFGKLRLMETELAELKTAVSTRETKDIVDSGNVDALRVKFQGEVDAEKKRASDLEKELHDVIVEKDIRGFLADKVVDVDDVWGLTKDFFTVGKDAKGKPIPIVKESSQSPQDFLTKWLEPKEHLRKNTQVGGSGATKGDAKNVPAATMSDLAKLPDGGREQLLKDPALARKILREM